METNTEYIEQLKKLLQERQGIAEELQNEVNQILASVLLWIQFTKMKSNLGDDESFQQAEINLKRAIEHVRLIYYCLSTPVAQEKEHDSKLS